MSRRDSRRTGLNPLDYIGVNPVASPDVIENDRTPRPNDRQFQIGDFWIYSLMHKQVPPDIYMLGSLARNYATWLKFATSSNSIIDYVTDSGIATNLNGIVVMKGDASLQTIASGATVSLRFRNIAPGHMFISDGSQMGPGAINSPNQSIDITLGEGTIDLVYLTTDGIHTDLGDAVRNGNLIKVLGGTNIATHAISNTVFVVTNTTPTIAGTFTLSSYGAGVVTADVNGLLYSSNGADGQVIISSSTGQPVWANITSSNGSLFIDNGPNSIDIRNVSTGGIQDIDGDTGTAVGVGGNIKILGGTNIVTSASGNTIVVDLAADVTLSGTLSPLFLSRGIVNVSSLGVLGANYGTVAGQTLIGRTGNVPAWGNITAADTSMTVTRTATGIDLKAGVISNPGKINTASPVAGVINILGSGGINTTGDGANTIRIMVDQNLVYGGAIYYTYLGSTFYPGFIDIFSNQMRVRDVSIPPSSPQRTPIGGGSSMALSSITSPNGSVVITQTSGPRTLNLEADYGFIEDSLNQLFLSEVSYSAPASVTNLGLDAVKIVICGIESFDPSGGYNSTTGVYTANRDGKYNFQGCYNFNKYANGPYDTEMKLWLVTSNRTYKARRKETLVKASPTSGQYLNAGMTFDACCDIDIGDTVTLQVSASYNNTDGFFFMSKGDGTFMSGFYIGR